MFAVCKRVGLPRPRKMKPTRKHRALLWECMLGTLYACNPKGQVKYFDYDWDAAVEYSGAYTATDLRIFKDLGKVKLYGILQGETKGETK